MMEPQINWRSHLHRHSDSLTHSALLLKSGEAIEEENRSFASPTSFASEESEVESRDESVFRHRNMSSSRSSAIKV